MWKENNGERKRWRKIGKEKERNGERLRNRERERSGERGKKKTIIT